MNAVTTLIILVKIPKDVRDMSETKLRTNLQKLGAPIVGGESDLQQRYVKLLLIEKYGNYQFEIFFNFFQL